MILVVTSRRHCSIITMPVFSWQHFRGWVSSPHTCDNAGMVGTLLFPGYPGESFSGGGHPQKPGLLWEEAEGQRRSRMLRGICGTLRGCQRGNLVKASKHSKCTSISICQVKWNVSAVRWGDVKGATWWRPQNIVNVQVFASVRSNETSEKYYQISIEWKTAVYPFYYLLCAVIVCCVTIYYFIAIYGAHDACQICLRSPFTKLYSMQSDNFDIVDRFRLSAAPPPPPFPPPPPVHTYITIQTINQTLMHNLFRRINLNCENDEAICQKAATTTIYIYYHDWNKYYPEIEMGWVVETDWLIDWLNFISQR